MSARSYDAVVVGSGPNGLAAAIVLAKAGRSVLIVEARDQVGGGCRSAELTLPGFVHDVCSAIHPMAVISPFFRTLPLAEFGLTWVHSPSALAHPLDGQPAALLEQSLDATCVTLGVDGDAYRGFMDPWVREADALVPDLLGPLRVPRHPFLVARFGLSAVRSAEGLARGRFSGHEARALLAGCAAHSFLRLDEPVSAAVGLMLLLGGHVTGWPFARGGSQTIADALARYFQSLGGRSRPVVASMRFPTSLRRPRCFSMSPRAARPYRQGSTPRGLPPRPRAVPLRARRFQAGLGPRGPHSLARSELRAGSHRARRGNPGRDCGGRGRRHGGRAPREAFRPSRAAEPVRSFAGPLGSAHRVGLLPRTSWVEHGHDRAHRGAGRALCAGLSRSHSCPEPDDDR